jgi:hypothetical protein
MDIKINNPDKYLDSVLFSRETGCTLFTLDGNLYIGGADSREHAEQLLAAHNPKDYSADKAAAQAKLAALGLTADDLKALGL